MKIINECKCAYCKSPGFPALWNIKLSNEKNIGWFEIPKNGSRGMKSIYHKSMKVIPNSKRSHFLTTQKSFFIYRDPVERFLSLLNHYFVSGNSVRYKWHGETIINKIYPKGLKSNEDYLNFFEILIDDMECLRGHEEHHFFSQSFFVEDFDAENVELIELSHSMHLNSVDYTLKTTHDKILSNRSDNKIFNKVLQKTQIEKIKKMYEIDYLLKEKYS